MKKMTKIALIAIVMMGLVGGVFAAGKAGTALYKPGNFSASIGIGFGQLFSLAFYPGVEFSIAQWDIADQFPLVFGVAVKGYFNSFDYGSYWGYSGYSDVYTYLGLGAFVTGHFGMKPLKLGNFFDRVDLYYAIGLVFNVVTRSGTYVAYYRSLFGRDPSSFNAGGIGFATYGGASYFITDGLFVFVEGDYWAYAGGASIGIGFKF